MALLFTGVASSFSDVFRQESRPGAVILSLRRLVSAPLPGHRPEGLCHKLLSEPARAASTVLSYSSLTEVRGTGFVLPSGTLTRACHTAGVLCGPDTTSMRKLSPCLFGGRAGTTNLHTETRDPSSFPSDLIRVGMDLTGYSPIHRLLGPASFR